MVINPQTVLIHWSNKNKSHFESKGYKYTKCRDGIIVDINDLLPNSKIKVKVSCDFCNKLYIKSYADIIKCYNKPLKSERTIACQKCSKIKNKQIFLEKYNVDNPNKLDTIIQKRKSTCMQKYNETNPSKSQVIKDKIIKTNKERYGCNYGFQNEIIKEKIYKTNIKRYGYKHVLLNKEIHAKAILTHKQRYGFEFSFQNKSILRKARKSLYENGTAPCSKPQKHIHKLLGGQLNYSIDMLLLDIAFPDEKVYIEYDGGGHDLLVKLGQINQQQFNEIQMKRQYYLKSIGWELIRIICKNDKLIDDNLIVNIINKAKIYLQTTEHSWILFDIDNMILKFNNFKMEVNNDIFIKGSSKL